MGEFLFDLYDLLVSNIFGSVVVASLALAAVITIIFLICRVRPNILTIWLLFFAIAMGTMTTGGLGLFVGFMFSGLAAVWQIIGYFSDRKGA